MKRFLQSLVLAGVMVTALPMAEAASIFVRIGPPPPVRVGVYGYRPGPNYVWVDGYHDYYGNGYRWVPGRWVLPPRGHRVWVGPRYEPYRGGYRYYRPYWR